MSDTDVKFPWEYTDEEIQEEGKHIDWSKSSHGKPVETRFDTYHDVTVFEDGHEERFYTGD